MSDEGCVLALAFLDDGREVGRLDISADSKSSDPVTASARYPACVISDLSKGIGYIETLAEMDGETPIQVYVGPDRSLAPLLLLENEVYEMALSENVTTSFEYLRMNEDEIPLRKLRFRGSGGESIYTLQFRNYVGKGVFDIRVDGKKIEIPFEVRSRKIGYFDEYPRMLSDIAEFSAALLMSIRAPLHTCYDLSDHGGTTVYEDFMVLDYIFSKLDLQGMYGYVKENRHTMLRSHTEVVPAGIASDVDPSDLISIVSVDNLVEMAGGPIGGMYAPLEVLEREWHDSHDTPENRVVKDLLLTIHAMVRSLRRSYQANESDYIGTRLSEMSETIDGMLCDQWLKDVGELQMIPYDSMVLQSRFGYSDLFHMYQILGLGASFRQDDAEEILTGQNKKLHVVYEYWCYTRIFKCLSRMANCVPEFPWNISDGRWGVSIRGGKATEFTIVLGSSVLTLDLYYNKGFSKETEGYRSYSVKLRPDFTLVVRSSSSPDRVYIVNFDAKYKVKPLSEKDLDVEGVAISSDSWEFDICKMHAYRDALLHSCGSYILFPGTKKEIFRKPWDQAEWGSRCDSFIPSVGAVPLTPGGDESLLESVIRDALIKIEEISRSPVAVNDLRNYLF